MNDSTREEAKMVATPSVPPGWRVVTAPPSLFRRFEFTSYQETRAFLERLASLSEETDLYPDLGFGKTHVNITVHAREGNSPSESELTFAARATALAVS